MSPAVSVIVPVYNSGKYLQQCLDSLAVQTLRDMEVILIDDGCTDGSGEVLEAYAARTPTFRLIKQVNRGYSAARNAGLKAAAGKYIGFVDSDDWIEPEMYSGLLQLAEGNQADIAQGGFACFYDRDGVSEVRDTSWIFPLLKRSDGRLKGAETLLFDEVAIWKRICLKSMLDRHGLVFDESMPMGEDLPFFLIATCLARKIADTSRLFYHYRKQRPGQQTGITDSRLFAYFSVFETMEDFVKREGLEYLRPWLLHLQLSRHCWGYEMAAPDVKPQYFSRLRDAFERQRVTAWSRISRGCWRHGGMMHRARFLSLIPLHRLALRFVLAGDQASFDKLIALRTWLQRPRGRTTLASPATV